MLLYIIYIVVTVFLFISILVKAFVAWRQYKAVTEFSKTFVFYEPEDQVAGLVVKCSKGDVEKLALIRSNGELCLLEVGQPDDLESTRRELFERYRLPNI